MAIRVEAPALQPFAEHHRASAVVTPAQAGLRLPGLQFLGLHFFVWTLASLFALVTAKECRSILHLPSLLYGAVVWGWWGVLASAVWTLGQRSPSFSPFSRRAGLVHLVAGPVVAYLHLVALWGLVFLLPVAERAPVFRSEWQRLVNLNRFGIELLTYGFVFGIIGAVQYHLRAQRDAIRQVELERQLSATQLHVLQMQLEPHFLFNTLNAITTLVEFGRQQQAAQMLSHLNTILKTTLARTTPQKVPVAKELEMVENYLAIEQIRFADRLRVEVQVDHEALLGLMPSFLLQPIVENAIRHGISSCEESGLIETFIQREGGVLHLRVRDSGSGATAPVHKGNGIGLKNIRERLLHFYQDRFEMTAVARESGGFEVAISIPYEQ